MLLEVGKNAYYHLGLRCTFKAIYVCKVGLTPLPPINPDSPKEDILIDQKLCGYCKNDQIHRRHIYTADFEGTTSEENLSDTTVRENLTWTNTTWGDDRPIRPMVGLGYGFEQDKNSSNTGTMSSTITNESGKTSSTQETQETSTVRTIKQQQVEITQTVTVASHSSTQILEHVVEAGTASLDQSLTTVSNMQQSTSTITQVGINEITGIASESEIAKATAAAAAMTRAAGTKFDQTDISSNSVKSNSTGSIGEKPVLPPKPDSTSAEASRIRHKSYASSAQSDEVEISDIKISVGQARDRSQESKSSNGVTNIVVKGPVLADSTDSHSESNGSVSSSDVENGNAESETETEEKANKLIAKRQRNRSSPGQKMVKSAIINNYRSTSGNRSSLASSSSHTQVKRELSNLSAISMGSSLTGSQAPVVKDYQIETEDTATKSEDTSTKSQTINLTEFHDRVEMDPNNIKSSEIRQEREEKFEKIVQQHKYMEIEELQARTGNDLNKIKSLEERNDRDRSVDKVIAEHEFMDVEEVLNKVTGRDPTKIKSLAERDERDEQFNQIVQESSYMTVDEVHNTAERNPQTDIKTLEEREQRDVQFNEIVKESTYMEVEEFHQIVERDPQKDIKSLEQRTERDENVTKVIEENTYIEVEDVHKILERDPTKDIKTLEQRTERDEKVKQVIDEHTYIEVEDVHKLAERVPADLKTLQERTDRNLKVTETLKEHIIDIPTDQLNKLKSTTSQSQSSSLVSSTNNSSSSSLADIPESRPSIEPSPSSTCKTQNTIVKQTQDRDSSSVSITIEELSTHSSSIDSKNTSQENLVGNNNLDATPCIKQTEPIKEKDFEVLQVGSGFTVTTEYTSIPMQNLSIIHEQRETESSEQTSNSHSHQDMSGVSSTSQSDVRSNSKSNLTSLINQSQSTTAIVFDKNNNEVLVDKSNLHQKQKSISASDGDMHNSVQQNASNISNNITAQTAAPHNDTSTSASGSMSLEPTEEIDLASMGFSKSEYSLHSTTTTGSSKVQSKSSSQTSLTTQHIWEKIQGKSIQDVTTLEQVTEEVIELTKSPEIGTKSSHHQEWKALPKKELSSSSSSSASDLKEEVMFEASPITSKNSKTKTFVNLSTTPTYMSGKEARRSRCLSSEQKLQTQPDGTIAEVEFVEESPKSDEQTKIGNGSAIYNRNDTARSSGSSERSNKNFQMTEDLISGALSSQSGKMTDDEQALLSGFLKSEKEIRSRSNSPVKKVVKTTLETVNTTVETGVEIDSSTFDSKASKSQEEEMPNDFKTLNSNSSSSIEELNVLNLNVDSSKSKRSALSKATVSSPSTSSISSARSASSKRSRMSDQSRVSEKIEPVGFDLDNESLAEELIVSEFAGVEVGEDPAMDIEATSEVLPSKRVGSPLRDEVTGQKAFVHTGHTDN